MSRRPEDEDGQNSGQNSGHDSGRAGQPDPDEAGAHNGAAWPQPRAAAPAPDPEAVVHEAEIISLPGRFGRETGSTEHLSTHRRFIVRRSLLASAVGGIVPLPVMDDYLAGRIRAGMLIQIGERRRVDLAPSSADLLADPREGTAVRNATMTAATLVALKLAWRKFFMLLAIGRRGEEMTTTFQVGTLFDHFCARLHVGAGVDRPTSLRLREAMFAAIRQTERAALIAAFSEGGRTLGRSIGEAPSWASRRLQKTVEHFVASGGNPDLIAKIEEGETVEGAGGEGPQQRWIDRATAQVEARIAAIGTHYLETLIANFERHWQAARSGDGPQPGGGAAPPRVP